MKIEGIDFIKKDSYHICYVNEFSDQLKTLIRNNLCMICNGKSAAENQKEYNNYKNTLKSLNERIENKKNSNLEIGMIGELIVHIIFSYYLSNYQSLSSLFNLEETNIKKGFDLVLQQGDELWITEVKSGHIHQNKSQDETIIELINTSKLDLNNRLNSGNLEIWINAINHAKQVLDNYRDEKEIVEDILNSKYVATQQNPSQSKNTNVILAGVLFHNIDEKITEAAINNKTKSIKSENLFNKVIVFAVQKSTIDEIEIFLLEEAQ